MTALTAISSTLGPRIAGFLDKTFLFAALLPTLLFAAAMAAVRIHVVGLDRTIAWVDGLEPTRAALYGLALFVVILLTAQMLAALRLVLLSLWSGIYPACPPPPLRDGLLRAEQRRRRALAASARPDNVHASIRDALREAVFAVWTVDGQEATRRTDADDSAKEALLEAGKRLGVAVCLADAEADIVATADLFRRHTSGSLALEWKSVVDGLDQAAASRQLDINRDAAELDRAFGPEATVRPTRLGNVLEAGDAYPFRRYEIEGRVFWPRLGFVASTEVLARLDDRRAALDFWIALATVSAVAVPFLAVAGLWAHLQPVVWLALTTTAVLSALASYRIATLAAATLTDQLCAACDILRFDVAAALRMPPARSLAFERREWQLRSQHALFGTVQNFAIAPASKGRDGD